MKKKTLLVIASAALCMPLFACGGNSSTPATEATTEAAPTTSAPAPSSSSQPRPSSSSTPRPSSSTAPVVQEKYLSVPFFSYEGSANPEATNTVKWEKNFTYTWKFNVDRAFESVELALGAQMSSSSHSDRTLFTNSSGADSSDTFESDSSNDGTPRLSITVNGVNYDITNRRTYGESGLSNSSLNYMRITSFPLNEGANTVSVKTHPNAGYRLMLGGDVRFFYTGDEGHIVTEPFVPGDGLFTDLTKFTAPIDIQTEKQKAFLEYTGDYAQFTTSTIQEYANGNANVSSPNAVRIEWEHAPKAEEYKYVVEVASDNEFKAEDTYSLEVKTKYANLYNFKLGETYFYRVKADYADAAVADDVSEAASFSILDNGLRNIHIDGITNCRDLGGKVLENGSRFKQGMIYRTSALNSSVAPAGHITDAGKAEMLNHLGVKAEIELRGGASGTGGEASSETSSDLGSAVKFNYTPMAYQGGKNLIYRNIEPLRKIFKVLGDERNYPVFFHCRIGTDRTGALALLINGLVGVSEQKIYQDYLFSNFGNIGKQTIIGLSGDDSVSAYVNEIKTFPGETFAQKVYNFLLTCGVAASDLDTIIRLCTEGDAKTENQDIVDMYKVEEATLDEGLTVASSSNFRSAPSYVALAANKKVTFNVTAKGDKANLFAYLNSSDTSATIDSALKVTVDGTPVALNTTSFATAELGLGGDYWIPAEIATDIDFTSGNHTIAIESLGTAMNLGFLAVEVA